MKKIFTACCLLAGSLLAEDIQFDQTDFTDIPKGKSDTSAIIMDKEGKIQEVKAAIENNVIQIPELTGGQNASVFLPDLGERFVWTNGRWVDKYGYSYDNNQKTRVNDPEWHSHWSDYWTKNWSPAWHKHWDVHHNDPNWRWKGDHHWNGHWHDHRRYNHSDHRRSKHREHRKAHKGHHSHHSHHSESHRK
jgi:hypothetical protein